MFDALFISQVVALALGIARLVRNEDHLQSPDILRRKFEAECQELAEAANIWDEIPDIVYYAACLVAWGGHDAIDQVTDEILPAYGVTVEQAKSACLAKYRRRAAGMPKDIEAERAVIMEAVET